MFGAVYYSTSLSCAELEYRHGTPLNSNDIKYTLLPQKFFELWDLDKVIKTLPHPSLSFLIDKLPIGGGWSNCKVPMPSQILAFWLMSIGGDGIIYTSIKEPSSKVIALFVRDDKESSGLVSIIKKEKS